MIDRRFFGVVEGFYRRPYTFTQRADFITFLARLGLNTYLYGPKLDPYHRRYYYIPYPGKTMREFEHLQKISHKHHVYLIYALSPGPKPDVKKIEQKIKQFINIGIYNFAVFFDDIKVERNAKTSEIQCIIANGLYDLLERYQTKPILLFCPTQYCGFAATEYILQVLKNLRQEIYLLWTGNRVVSFRITRPHLEKITRLYQRKPVIWDNFFANDYMPPGVVPGIPYRGRDPAITRLTSGVLLNPMNEYAAAKQAVYTAALFFRQPTKYQPAVAWQKSKTINFL